MAKFPDCTVLSYIVDFKKLTVDVETRELVKCKNCLFSKIKDEEFDDGTVRENVTFCCRNDEYDIAMSPDAYCSLAVPKELFK